ncbi:hypothetical protein [Streptomyces sp. MI02-7b]|nr:hypothetical protein [Streptomyces sp. MI02-7b]MDX3071593.1 hypothetical protein [Streptomyces sp. MI02-7b]
MTWAFQPAFQEGVVAPAHVVVSSRTTDDRPASIPDGVAALRDR